MSYKMKHVGIKIKTNLRKIRHEVKDKKNLSIIIENNQHIKDQINQLF